MSESYSVKLKLKADEKNNQISLPEEIIKLLGLSDEANVEFIVRGNRIEIIPDIHCLAKVYIEPTTKCNIACKTCIRNTWNEPLGDMSIQVFDNIVEQLKAFESVKTVMFGGFGEPAFHRDILYMIRKIKSLGLNAEMTTNGMLLSGDMIEQLLSAELNMLWISFDGTESITFENMRAGAKFDQIIDSLNLLKKMNSAGRHRIDIGIAFVATKYNINDLKSISHLAGKLDAKKVLISNVLPYDKDMEKEMLYKNSISLNYDVIRQRHPGISIPRIDINEETKEALHTLFRTNKNISLMGQKLSPDVPSCRFIEERCTFIRWDGMVSPCMGMMHPYDTFLHGQGRHVNAYILGDTKKTALIDIWNSEEYYNFRERVHNFEFSPCHLCGGCGYFESNDEDCYGNKGPVCGACLWAHGFIQCP